MQVGREGWLEFYLISRPLSYLYTSKFVNKIKEHVAYTILRLCYLRYMPKAAVLTTCPDI